MSDKLGITTSVHSALCVFYEMLKGKLVNERWLDQVTISCYEILLGRVTEAFVPHKDEDQEEMSGFFGTIMGDLAGEGWDPIEDKFGIHQKERDITVTSKGTELCRMHLVSAASPFWVVTSISYRRLTCVDFCKLAVQSLGCGFPPWWHCPSPTEGSLLAFVPTDEWVAVDAKKLCELQRRL